MPTIKEFREFFLREIAQTSGSKADQEANYPTNYLVRGKSVFNRFLRNHFPSEGIMKKFLESIGFKLNPEDTATTSTQGFVKKASDTNAETRALNPGSDMAVAVTTHQLPEIVTSTDGNDATIAAVTVNGLTVTSIRRTLSGLWRKNYKIEVAPQDSLVFDGSTHKLKLDGDAPTPGNQMSYGTDVSGTKGWYPTPQPQQGIYLSADHNLGSVSVTPVVLGTGGNLMRIRLAKGSNQKYRFEVLLFVNTIDGANGIRVGLYGFGGLAVNFIKWQVEVLENNTTAFALKTTVSALNTDAAVSGPVVGTVVRISGVADVTTLGDLEVRAALNLGASGPAVLLIGTGSHFLAQRLIETKPTV